jgi:hypothetical protein
MIMYIIWIHFDPAPECGGRMSPWLRGIRLWKFFAEYYPASCVPSFLDTLSSERGLFNQGTRRQVLYLLLGSYLPTVSRSAIYLQIGLTCLAITPMVCLYTPGAYILSLNAHLSPGIISM